jgi:DNA mismatch repair protein MutS
VAEIAGVPRDVVDRAREYLRRLEKHQQALLPASPQTELAFAAIDAPTEEQRRVLERLAKLDIDALSPRAALDLLYELARDAK